MLKNYWLSKKSSQLSKLDYKYIVEQNFWFLAAFVTISLFNWRTIEIAAVTSYYNILCYFYSLKIGYENLQRDSSNLLKNLKFSDIFNYQNCKKQLIQNNYFYKLLFVNMNLMVWFGLKKIKYTPEVKFENIVKSNNKIDTFLPKNFHSIVGPNIRKYSIIYYSIKFLIYVFILCHFFAYYIEATPDKKSRNYKKHIPKRISKLPIDYDWIKKKFIGDYADIV